MISYQYTEVENVLYVTFNGEVSYSDVNIYFEEFKLITNLPNDLKLLFNFTNAKLKIKSTDLPTLIKQAKLATEKYNSVKTAFVSNDPKITALSYLFAKKNERKGIERKIFSALPIAIDWLIAS